MKKAFVYVSDERGFELTIHSAMSLALSQPRPCHIHIFCYAFSRDLPTSLAGVFATHGAKVIFDHIGDDTLERHQSDLAVAGPRIHKLPAVGKLLGEYDRVIYLDNDLLIFDDLQLDSID